jgi:hypothetical protein
MVRDRTAFNESRRTFEYHGGIGTNKDGNAACTTGWSSSTLSVNGNIASDDNGVPPIPGPRFNPVNGVEKRGGTSMASILRIDAFNIKVPRLGEKIHECRFHRLGFVDSFSADVKAANRFRVDIEFLQ